MCRGRGAGAFAPARRARTRGHARGARRPPVPARRSARRAGGRGRAWAADRRTRRPHGGAPSRAAATSSRRRSGARPRARETAGRPWRRQAPRRSRPRSRPRRPARSPSRAEARDQPLARSRRKPTSNEASSSGGWAGGPGCSSSIRADPRGSFELPDARARLDPVPEREVVTGEHEIRGVVVGRGEPPSRHRLAAGLRQDEPVLGRELHLPLQFLFHAPSLTRTSRERHPRCRSHVSRFG